MSVVYKKPDFGPDHQFIAMFYFRGVNMAAGGGQKSQFGCWAEGLGVIPCSSGTDSIIGSVFVYLETQMARAGLFSEASDDAQAYERAYLGCFTAPSGALQL